MSTFKKKNQSFPITNQDLIQYSGLSAWLLDQQLEHHLESLESSDLLNQNLWV